MRYIAVILLSNLWGQTWTDYLRSPVKWTIGLTNGYDNNVLRLSPIEKDDAALNQTILGGAETFDSHYIRFSLSGLKKIQLVDREKQIQLFAKSNFSNYAQYKHRQHWSGYVKASYHWGAYRRLEYMVRHLNDYYMRHYKDLDITVNQLFTCSFTDREQRLLVSHPIKLRLWVTGSLSYIQRYYDRSFTEFDSDIVTTALKVSKRFRDFGTVSVEGKYGIADNITFEKVAKSSNLDRSYRHMELYIPMSYDQGVLGLNEVGFSLRTDFRQYRVEDISDPLHSGRSHRETKFDIWGEKNLKENLMMSCTIRFRNRYTDSRHDWVSELKSFDQLQAWISIEWKMLYDRY